MTVCVKKKPLKACAGKNFFGGRFWPFLPFFTSLTTKDGPKAQIRGGRRVKNGKNGQKRPQKNFSLRMLFLNKDPHHSKERRKKGKIFLGSFLPGFGHFFRVPTTKDGPKAKITISGS